MYIRLVGYKGRWRWTGERVGGTQEVPETGEAIQKLVGNDDTGGGRRESENSPRNLPRNRITENHGGTVALTNCEKSRE